MSEQPSSMVNVPYDMAQDKPFNIPLDFPETTVTVTIPAYPEPKESSAGTVFGPGPVHAHDDPLPEERVTQTMLVGSKLRQLFENELMPLYHRKSSGYGSDADPLANLRRRGVRGIIIRLEDKMFRLGNLADGAAEYDERMEDTLQDVVMYAMYAILMARGAV